MSLFTNFEIIGHRGARGYAPENTLPSFEKGIEMGVTMVEFDLRFTADNQIVVIHDEAVDRVTNGSGKVRNLNYQEIKALDAGSHFSKEYAGAYIPLFDEVLDLIKGKAGGLIEIKIESSWNEPKNIELVVKKIIEHGMLDQVEIISFSHLIVKNFKIVEPRIKTGILYVSAPVEPWLDATLAGADVIHPCPSPGLQVLLPEVEDTHYHHLKLGATTQDKEEMSRLIRYGVDGICTDYPDILVDVYRNIKLQA